jgi:type I restriction enzyme S subunit
VIADLKPYAEYKESGLPWASALPSHWVTKRGKSYLVAIDQRSKAGREELLTVSSARGVVPRSSAKVTMFKAESYAGHKLCWPEDLVINSLWAWGGGLGVSQHHGIISTAYSVYRSRPSAQINPRFLHELVRSSAFHWELQVRSKGVWISRLQLTDTSFLDAPIPLPPPAEQAAIVRFLDWANGRLERAIRAKRKVIALLNEQKQAIIHRAVIRGLDPSVPLKPSGIPWLGDIPQHWEVKKLRFLFRYAKGSRAAELTNEYIGGNAGPFPVYSGQTGAGGLMGSINWHEFEFPAPVVFVSTVGARAMTTRLVQGEFSLSQNCALIIPRRDDVVVAFFESVFQRLCAYERASISLIMQPSLRFADLNRFYVPHPPHVEQVAIVRDLSQQVAARNTAISRLEREIELLREYRTRLVADVVTGKLDVREAAARLPDEAAPDTVEDDTDMSPDPGAADEEAVV